MTPLESKLPSTGTTIFSVMTQLAERHGAINLSQGFPDFDPPRELIEQVAVQLDSHHNQYAPMPGVLELREAIAAKLQASYGLQADPAAAITVTAGATEALFCAIHTVVKPGDEVIVLDPAYDSYEPAVALAGGRTVHVPLTAPDFTIDWQRLEDALGPRTRLIVVNSPHNPTGSLLVAEDLDRLAAMLRPYACYVLSDEVYEHIVFDGHAHASVLTQSELAERSFACFSFGKTYHATGWKVGYCVAPAALMREFRRIHQYLTFAVVTPLQYALARYLTACPEHHEQLGGFYGAKRDLFRRLLAPSAFELLPCKGTYFQLADYSALSDLTDVDFARWLTAEHGVAAIPVSVFYEDPPPQRLVRFCFAKQDTTLEAAAERLGDAR
jgi:methionine aminotransferase